MPWEQLPIVPGQEAPNFVAVGSAKNIWGVNTASGVIYQWDVSKQVWNVMTGDSSFISVGADGSVWCINNEGGVDQWVEEDKNWKNMGTYPTMQVSAGSATQVWAIQTNNTVIQYNPFAPWAPIETNVLMKWVCVAEAKSYSPPVWGINTSGQLLQYDWQELDWTEISGTPAGVSFSQVALIDRYRALCLSTDNKLYFRNYGGTWRELPGSFLNISAAEDGTMWGVNTLGQICYDRRCPPPPSPEQPLTLVVDGDSQANYKTLAANVANGYEMIGLMAVYPIDPTNDCYPKILPGTVFLFPGIKAPVGTTPTAYQGTVSINCKAQPPIIEYTGQTNALPLHLQMCELMGNKYTTYFIGFSIKNTWDTKDGVVFDSEICNSYWFGTRKIPECDCNSINWRAQIMTALANSLK